MIHVLYLIASNKVVVVSELLGTMQVMLQRMSL